VVGFTGNEGRIKGVKHQFKPKFAGPMFFNANISDRRTPAFCFRSSLRSKEAEVFHCTVGALCIFVDLVDESKRAFRSFDNAVVGMAQCVSVPKYDRVQIKKRGLSLPRICFLR
jgi:hypothetical protein